MNTTRQKRIQYSESSVACKLVADARRMRCCAHSETGWSDHQDNAETLWRFSCAFITRRSILQPRNYLELTNKDNVEECHRTLNGLHYDHKEFGQRYW